MNKCCQANYTRAIAMEYTSLISVQVHISLANKTSDTDKI